MNRGQREKITEYLIESLEALGGKGKIIPLAQDIWKKHEDDIRIAGDLFYTWQYEMRWAAKVLRDRGIMKPAKHSPIGVWELS